MGTLHGSALAQLGRQCDVAVAAAPLDDVEQNADTGFTHGGHGLAEGGEHGVDVFRNTDAVDGDDGAIAGDGAPAFAQGAHCADGHVICNGKYCRKVGG